MNYVLSLGKEIIEKRKLIWDLGKADFRKRFVGSYFGIVWMFILGHPMWPGWSPVSCPGSFTVNA